MSEEAAGEKRPLNAEEVEVESAEQGAAKRAKVEEAVPEAGAAPDANPPPPAGPPPGPPAGPPPAGPPAGAPPAEGGSGRGQNFAGLSPAIQQMFTTCFEAIGSTKDELDSSVYDSLCDFPEETQTEIVTSFCRSDLSTIRNKTGYFIGILKTHRKKRQEAEAAGAYGGYPTAYPGYPHMGYGQAAPTSNFQKGPKPAEGYSLASLPAAVSAVFQGIFAQGIVAEADLDKSIYDSLMDFDEATQINIVERYASASLSTVRNKTGYFISILKAARQARSSGQPFGASSSQGGYQQPAAAYPQHNPYDPWAAYYAAMAQQQQQQQGQQPAADPAAQQQYAQQYAQMDPQWAAYYAAQGYGAQPAQAAAAAPQAATGAGGLPASFSKITPGAQAKLSSLYNSYMLQAGDLEDCVFDSLCDFPEPEQMQMCESFTGANLMSVRNKTAFFIGILKRHRQSKMG